MRRAVRKALETFSTVTATVSLIVCPPAAGVLAMHLWQPYAGEIPALLSGIWTAAVVAALIKWSFE